jgi:hypothetical protein
MNLEIRTSPRRAAPGPIGLNRDEFEERRRRHREHPRARSARVARVRGVGQGLRKL